MKNKIYTLRYGIKDSEHPSSGHYSKFLIHRVKHFLSEEARRAYNLSMKKNMMQMDMGDHYISEELETEIEE